MQAPITLCEKTPNLPIFPPSCCISIHRPGRRPVAQRRRYERSGRFGRRLAQTRLEEPIANGKGDVEVSRRHRAGIVVRLVVSAEAAQETDAAENAVWRRVMAKVEPLVGEEVTHGR